MSPSQPTEAVRRASYAPSRKTLEACRDRLLDFVSDFAFEAPSDCAAWLAGVLTTVGRPHFYGPSPLFLVEADQPGLGCAALAQLAALITTGERMPTIDLSVDHERQLSELGAVFRAQRKAVCAAYGRARFGSAALDAALTADAWSVRALGKYPRTFPQVTTWWATGRNVRFNPEADTDRRTVLIRLRANRANLTFGARAQALFTDWKDLRFDAAKLLLGYYAVPEQERPALPAWGSFDRWSALIRGALVWLDLPDPFERRQDDTARGDA